MRHWGLYDSVKSTAEAAGIPVGDGFRWKRILEKATKGAND
jgi:hypothetical protein